MANCSNVFCEFCAFCESVKQFCEFCELCAFCEFCELRVKPPLQPCQKGFYKFCEFCELCAFCELSFIILKCLCTIRRIRKLFTGFKWYVQALATSRNRHMKTNTPKLTGTVANAPFHAMVYLKVANLAFEVASASPYLRCIIQLECTMPECDTSACSDHEPAKGATC